MAGPAAIRLPTASRKAEAPLLRPSMGKEEALKAIVASCLDHYRANEEPLLASGSVDALHQARVALRRLRSALSLITPLLPEDPDMKTRRKELKRLTRKFGEVRELDVLASGCNAPARDNVLAHRNKAFARLAKALRSRRTRRLMEDLAAWAARPAAGEAREWAGGLLDGRLARVRRKGARLASVSDKKRHELRIEIKKLRYGAQFLASLYSSAKAQRRCASFLKTLSSLQDLLGELNDLDTAPRLFARYEIEADIRIAEGARDRLLKKAERAWRDFAAAAPFWHAA